MKRKLQKTEIAAIAAIIFGLGLFIDILTHTFAPAALIFSIVMLIIGWHYRSKGKRKRGVVALFIGGLIFIMNVFSSVAFQLLFAASILYVGYELLQSRRAPAVVQLETKKTEAAGLVVRRERFFKNMLIGQYRVMDHVYELHDINIRYGVGDVQLDLTTAMIPEGETVIVIHGLVGNIRLYMPYDMEASYNHSMLFGHASISGQREGGWNQNIVMQTEQYQRATRRVKIISSLLVGDIEVRYV